jgi:hypothetical protein
MDPQAALEEQIAGYRRMTGEQRLGIALDLHEFACDLARAGILAQNPGADETEVERQLHKRLALSRELQVTTAAGLR